MQHFIYIKVPGYLKNFVESQFGNPVELIKGSPESRIMKNYLARWPKDKTFSILPEENLQIVIPFYKLKPPHIYCFLSPKAKICLANSFKEIFDLCIWRDIILIKNPNCKLSDLISAFMEKYNIDLDYECAVSQRVYRLREIYKKKDINL